MKANRSIGGGLKSPDTSLSPPVEAEEKPQENSPDRTSVRSGCQPPKQENPDSFPSHIDEGEPVDSPPN